MCILRLNNEEWRKISSSRQARGDVKQALSRLLFFRTVCITLALGILPNADISNDPLSSDQMHCGEAG